MAKATRYKVKRIKDGPYAGKWGVYLGKQLQMHFGNKSSATRDADHRNDAEKRW